MVLHDAPFVYWCFVCCSNCVLVILYCVPIVYLCFICCSHCELLFLYVAQICMCIPELKIALVAY